MLYYTPDLVNRWQSDYGEASKEVYDQEWDDTQDAYERHFTTTEFPLSVRKFFNLVLHDELVMSLPKATDVDNNVIGYFPNDDYIMVLSNDRDDCVHILTYTLEKPPTIKHHSGHGFDSIESDPVWLYDEFDLDDAGLFRHSVLFSNGMELNVTFKSMHWLECNVINKG